MQDFPDWPIWISARKRHQNRSGILALGDFVRSLAHHSQIAEYTGTGQNRQG